MNGLRGFISRYRPSYLRALVYMLQASEYNVREYIDWFHRTTDFTRVERRKGLVMTHKARLLLLLLWVWVLISIVGMAYSFVETASDDRVLLAMYWLFGLVTLPFGLAYAIVLPLFVGHVIVQRPRERFINRQTQRYLSKVPAVKIAIAGSYGKTTFKDILATTLAAGKRVAATPGNYNTPIGINRFIRQLSGEEEILIFELGEYYPGDIQQLAELVDPQIGVITGVNEAHLVKFKTLERTLGTIFELADYLGEGKPLYVNGESQLAAAGVRQDHLAYSQAGVGGWAIKAGSVKTGLRGISFETSNGKVVIRAQSRLLGLHQAGPLVAAISIAYDLGLSKAQIEKGVAETKPFAHRLQPREEVGGVVTIDDSYNGSPDGVRVAIEFLAGLKKHRRIYVTPGLVEMGVRTKAVHLAIGRQLVAARVEMVILVRNSVTLYIEEGLVAGKYSGQVRWFDDGPSCFAALPSLTVKGDVVLLQNDWPDNYA